MKTSRSRLVSLTAATVVVAASGLVAADRAAADNAQGDNSGNRKVLQLQWALTDKHDTDVPPAGTSSGDDSQFSFNLTGDARGTADYACTVVGTRYLCDGILRLPAGDIYVSTGPLDDSQPAAIVGGTKAYFGIRGQFKKTATPTGTGTYTLTYVS